MTLYFPPPFSFQVTRHSAAATPFPALSSLTTSFLVLSSRTTSFLVLSSWTTSFLVLSFSSFSLPLQGPRFPNSYIKVKYAFRATVVTSPTHVLCISPCAGGFLVLSHALCSTLLSFLHIRRLQEELPGPSRSLSKPQVIQAFPPHSFTLTLSWLLYAALLPALRL